jgi:hypothetical protein
VGKLGSLVLIAGKGRPKPSEPEARPDREAVPSARLAERLEQIEQAGGRVLVMERKRGSATWLLTVDGLN